MIKKDDWRLRGQEEYLFDKSFIHKRFAAQNGHMHKHCEFCWHKFMESCEGIKDCSNTGYCTEDGLYWVCESCYEDFKDCFHFHLSS